MSTEYRPRAETVRLRNWRIAIAPSGFGEPIVTTVTAPNAIDALTYVLEMLDPNAAELLDPDYASVSPAPDLVP